MFNLKRNQVLITILVFMIAITAYLSNEGMKGYTTDGQLASDTDFAMTNMEEEQEVNQPLTVADATERESFTATISKKSEELYDPEDDVAVSKSLDVNYFAEEKLLREQKRAEQIEQLNQYAQNESFDNESRVEAAANLLEIQERVEKESSAEALLRAKGFQEVYVRIDEDTVDVVVNKAELTDTDIAQIEEIVNRKTGYNVGKINITPFNGVIKK